MGDTIGGLMTTKNQNGRHLPRGQTKVKYLNKRFFGKKKKYDDGVCEKKKYFRFLKLDEFWRFWGEITRFGYIWVPT